MSAAAIPPKAVQAPDTRTTARRRDRAAPHVVGVIGRCCLAVLALALVWLLVSAEMARDNEAGCRHRGYRDPVTGQQVERRC